MPCKVCKFDKFYSSFLYTFFIDIYNTLYKMKITYQKHRRERVPETRMVQRAGSWCEPVQVEPGNGSLSCRAKPHNKWEVACAGNAPVIEAKGINLVFKSYPT